MESRNCRRTDRQHLANCRIAIARWNSNRIFIKSSWRANKRALDKFISLAWFSHEVFVLAAGPAGPVIVEVGFAAADRLGGGAANDDGGAFVESNTENLRIPAHELGHVAVTAALREVLINGDSGQEPKSALVTFGHHVGIA